ncbi:MAG: hypothetical protein OT477_02900 [Chloroflexi bacterium]|nr:hypothetical protein [Chloroflexota bacterium]
MTISPADPPLCGKYQRLGRCKVMGGWHGPMPYVSPMPCAVPPTPTTLAVGHIVGGCNVVGVGLAGIALMQTL